MKKYSAIYNNSIEFKVKSELYYTTTCVVDIPSFNEGRTIFPCADGCDYELSAKEIKDIKKLIKEAN